MNQSLEQKFWFFLVLFSLIFSGVDPVADRLTWLLETVPVMIGLIVLATTPRAVPDYNADAAIRDRS